jgi:hypothetical protein
VPNGACVTTPRAPIEFLTAACCTTSAARVETASALTGTRSKTVSWESRATFTELADFAIEMVRAGKVHRSGGVCSLSHSR